MADDGRMWAQVGRGNEMTALTVCFAVLLTLVCWSTAFFHARRLKRVSLLDWSLLAMGGMYGLCWAYVLLVTESGGNPVWARWIIPYSTLYLTYVFCAFLSAIGVIGGWYIAAVLPKGLVSLPYARASAAGTWASSFWIMLLIAVLLQGVYARAYGGIVGSLQYSELIRAALFQSAPANSFSFLRPFGGLAMMSCFGFWGLLLAQRRRLTDYVGFLCSLLFSLYILYSWGGRVAFIVFLASLILSYSMHNAKRKYRIILGAPITLLLMLFAVYGVAIWLDIKPAKDFSTFVVREVSFPFASFFASTTVSGAVGREFIDFILSPMYFLPSSWWSNWFTGISQLNTTVILGVPKGLGQTSGIPVDLIALGMYEGGAIGVPLVGFMFGVLLRVLQRLIDNIVLAGVRHAFLAYVSLQIALLAVFYAQPALVINENLILVVGAAIVAVLGGMRALTRRISLRRTGRGAQ